MISDLSPRSEFLSGIRAELPIALSVIPFGLIFGVVALAAGIPPLLAVAMSSIVFAGSSQFIGAQLMGVGAPSAVVILTTLAVNLRHALYSASLAPYLRHLSVPWRTLLSYLLTDEAYAVSITRYQKYGGGPTRHFHLLGAGLVLWACWQACTAIGIFLGAQVPASWELDFTLALTFIALAVPGLRDRPTFLAALSAGLTAVLAYNLPYKLGLFLAALAGIGVGLLAERFSAVQAPLAEVQEAK